MTSPVDHDLSARISRLERRWARQRAAFVLTLLLGALIGIVLSRAMPEVFAQAQTTDQILTVRGLVVVDDRGIERVRLGAPLPDPISLGRRVPRQGVVSGMLIFDADGDERGGYVTNSTGDPFLTLDAKGRQQAIFLANRDGGAHLTVWNGPNRNDNFASLRSISTPLLEMVSGGKSVFRAGGPDAFSK